MPELIYKGKWPELGELYDLWTGKLYTTICVGPTENIFDKIKRTWAKFGYQEN